MREVGGEWGDVAEGAFEEFVGGIGRDGGGGFGYHDSYYFLFLLIMIYSLVMILGWVDQIGRKGNIVYSSSSCSLSFVPLSVYLPKEFTYEKRNNSRTIPEHLFITNLLHVPYL